MSDRRARTEEELNAPGSSAPGETGDGQAPVLRQQAERLLQVVAPAASVAQRFAGFFGTLSVLAGLSAVVLFMVLFLPVASLPAWKVIGLIVLAFAFLIPAAILGLFWLGLKQLMSVPAEVAQSLGDIELQGRSVIAASTERGEERGRLRALLGLVRSLVDVRSALLQSKDVFFRTAVLVRIANPITLVAVLAATTVAVIMVSATLLVAAILLLT